MNGWFMPEIVVNDGTRFLSGAGSLQKPAQVIPCAGMIQCRSMPATRKLLPYLALGVTILSLSFAAFFVRWADAPAAVFGFYRLGIATLILTPFFVRNTILSQRKPQPHSLRGWILILPVLAGLASALDHFTWNTSLKFTSAANATLLGNTSPLWVALAAWLIFRERTKGLFWVGLALTMCGAVAVLSNDFLQHPVLGLGDLLALSTGIFYAIFFLFSQRSRTYFDTLSHVWICSLSSTLVLLILTLATGSGLTGYSPRTYLVFLAAALLPQLAGYLTLGYALGHLPASVVSPTMLGQPVLTALLAIPLLGENLQPVQWIGGLVVIAGIYLVHRSREAAPDPIPGN
jgi:drug/metabolite transporter (DMT)-like permease